MALEMYNHKLRELLKELREQKGKLDAFLEIIFTKINTYTLALESSSFHLSMFHDFTNDLTSLRYNFNEEGNSFIQYEVSYLFLETLRKVKIINLSSLIQDTNPYFYSKIIALGEEYILAILDKKDPIYIELLEKKQNSDPIVYIEFLYKLAYDLRIMRQETIFIPCR